jgi:hypothetical protein
VTELGNGKSSYFSIISSPATEVVVVLLESDDPYKYFCKYGFVHAKFEICSWVFLSRYLKL